MRYLKIAFLWASSLFPTLVFAVSEAPPQPTLPAGTPIIEEGPTTLADWFVIIQDIAGWFFSGAVIIGVLMLIVAGVFYMTATGSQTRVQTAVKMMIYAIVGVAVSGLAWGIVQLIGNFFVGQKLVE